MPSIKNICDSKEERRMSENKKIDCARKHFATIADTQVKYDVITNYTDLLNLVQG